MEDDREKTETLFKAKIANLEEDVFNKIRETAELKEYGEKLQGYMNA